MQCAQRRARRAPAGGRRTACPDLLRRVEASAGGFQAAGLVDAGYPVVEQDFLDALWGGDDTLARAILKNAPPLPVSRWRALRREEHARKADFFTECLVDEGLKAARERGQR